MTAINTWSMTHFNARGGVLIIILLSVLYSCSVRQASRELYEPQHIREVKKSKYLKVHVRNGDLYLLETWKSSETNRMIYGVGSYLNANRKVLKTIGTNTPLAGQFRIPFDDIVVVETNDRGYNPGVPAIVLAGLVTVPIAIQCLADPKACFGSCPTFYVKNDTTSRLVAEGFSSSICRALEETDVDFIDFPMMSGDSLEVIVKNEALETHMIKEVHLLDFEKKAGTRVAQGLDNRFYEISPSEPPVKALSGTSSIWQDVAKKDQYEWFSLADSNNLIQKEDVFLEFENHPGRQGLLLDVRQSLITTYLFYEALSLAGRSMPDYYVQMEAEHSWIKDQITKLYDLLGGIDIAVKDQNGQWVACGTVRESGPIVTDAHLVLLPEINTSMLQLRLRMSKGLWRINRAGLSRVGRTLQPVRLAAHRLMAGSRPEATKLERLLNPEDYLITYPGEEYRLLFPGTVRKEHEYFVESRGYYLEWMREEWLKHENLAAAKMMLMFPKAFLKKSAPLYKEHEPMMEKLFWASRYTNHEK